MPKEQYQPSPEEVTRAEEMMTEERGNESSLRDGREKNDAKLEKEGWTQNWISRDTYEQRSDKGYKKNLETQEQIEKYEEEEEMARERAKRIWEFREQSHKYLEEKIERIGLRSGDPCVVTYIGNNETIEEVKRYYDCLFKDSLCFRSTREGNRAANLDLDISKIINIKRGFPSGRSFISRKVKLRDGSYHEIIKDTEPYEWI